ncbi:hypothetical protein A9F13_18g00902 [Clavispora lusitaniae]|uniref:Uncharacterized protein n=1 Tax=Clavispora lusitaniae TaxID=36911 RepID=A0AA91PWE9_CLALS|nr:hypothetical protein A9F13_18g00902 [Clavispora lusitaniae]
MSRRESSEALLELEEVHGSPNLPSHSEDERMTLEVDFRLWFNYENHPLHRVRFVFDKNASIEEASRTAFQKCVGKVPDEFYMFIAKGINEVWAVGDKDEKISSVVHEGERLLLSDVRDYLQRSTKRAFKILLGVMVGIAALVAVIIIISA